MNEQQREECCRMVEAEVRELRAARDAHEAAQVQVIRADHRPGHLTAKDVCDIITVSKKNSVLSLKLGDLSIEFNQTPKARASSQKQRAEAATYEEPIPSSPYAQTDGERAERASLTDDPDLLMVEDPVAYEAFLMEQDEQEREAN